MDFYRAQFLVEILADTVDKTFADIGGELCTGVGGKIDETSHRTAHIGADFVQGITLHRVGNVDTRACGA